MKEVIFAPLGELKVMRDQNCKDCGHLKEKEEI